MFVFFFFFFFVKPFFYSLSSCTFDSVFSPLFVFLFILLLLLLVWVFPFAFKHLYLLCIFVFIHQLLKLLTNRETNQSHGYFSLMVNYIRLKIHYVNKIVDIFLCDVYFSVCECVSVYCVYKNL